MNHPALLRVCRACLAAWPLSCAPFAPVCAESLPVSAVSSAPAAEPALAASVPLLATVAVSGVQPGPGLWKVSRGDHVLWILGLVSPLPRQMQWQSTQVTQVIAHAQAVLEPPSVHMKLHTSFFGRLLMLPSLIGARDNPDGRHLQQVVPAASYAQWQVLKAKYLGDKHKVERWRPVFAAYELYRKALKQAGLSHVGGVVGAVRSLADQYHVPREPTRLELVIEHPRHALKTFKHSPLDDVGCFQSVLDNLGADMQALTQRANAWAVGDLTTLRRLYRSDERATCLSAVTDAGFAHQLGLDDIPAHEKAYWLGMAEQALAKNTQSFAILPMESILGRRNNYLEALQAQGYYVEAPDEDPAPATSALPAPGLSAMESP